MADMQAGVVRGLETEGAGGPGGVEVPDLELMDDETREQVCVLDSYQGAEIDRNGTCEGCGWVSV